MQILLEFARLLDVTSVTEFKPFVQAVKEARAFAASSRLRAEATLLWKAWKRTIECVDRGSFGFD